ncbi:SDR family NAD(P)-dependent oxidoreductase [Erythrobacteraceae bacterium CFH 75059]|uniref:oxidoreductase n=1 Tax=Qipengyuania thermophila TaxID=2509361 RepID=UPI001020D858|nr:oxidoreductase [Qipengyuania thermophila]TCD02256.1 SDR family NAD(P)-dependent oxidoreductase [Erythrobacteraceae bacterium CFH 75059]
MTPFRFSDIPDQTGRTVLVTGANTGIGWHIARHLARRGAKVLLGCRDPRRGEEAVARLRAEASADAPALVQLDLADGASIRAAAARVAEEERLDALINNAGVMMPPLGFAHGAEQQFGVNHLGHFLLTALLLDRLAADGGGRVVVQASLAHRRAHIAWDNLDARSGYAPQRFYQQSKLANLLFAFALDRRLRAAGVPVKAVACHPGFAQTEIVRHLGPARAAAPLIGMLFNTAEDGALPALHAATGPEVEGGAYLGPYGLAELRGRASGPAVASAAARDADAADRLWQLSETMTGTPFEIRSQLSA